MKLTFLRSALLTTLLASTGCTAISFSAIGSIADLGNSAVTVGSDKFYFGSLTTAEMTDPNTARQAALDSADELGLYLKCPGDYADGTATLHFLDEKGMEITVVIERRSASLVRIRCDVGLFGNEVTDRLFLSRMRSHLPHPNGPYVQVHATTVPAK